MVGADAFRRKLSFLGTLENRVCYQASMASPLSYLTASILGIVQGITEFLPISSSGHIAIAGLFMGVEDASMETIVLLHTGTLLATCMVLRRDLTSLVLWLAKPSMALSWRQQPEAQLSLAVIVACIPTVVLGLLIEPIANRFVSDPKALAVCFCITASLLFVLRRAPVKPKSLTLPIAVIIGIAQGIAVLPGISRSGITLACGMLLGLRAHDAFRFSFLISIPTIVGATLYTGLGHPFSATAWGPLMWGATVAAVVGYAALIFVRYVLQQQRIWWFSLYLYPLGIAVWLWSMR